MKNEEGLLKKFPQFFNDKYNNTASLVGAHNVIPNFDPKSKTQTAEIWLRKVNETALIYKLQERQIIFYALPKLSGLAKRWYEGLSSLDLTWKEWQAMILNTFPDDRNYADKLSEMLQRHSRREESLEEYFYVKISLVNVYGIAGKNAVDCIVHGIYDSNIRLNAQGPNFQNTLDLLKFLRNISSGGTNIAKTPYMNKTFNNSDKSFKSFLPNQNRLSRLRCFNCSEVGHTHIKCTKPPVKCGKCNRLGHERAKCPTNTANLSKTSTHKTFLRLLMTLKNRIINTIKIYLLMTRNAWLM